MEQERRTFFKTLGTGCAAISLGTTGCAAPQSKSVDYSEFDEILKQPVFNKELFTSPVIIESVSLLHYNENFIVQVRSKDGAEGHAVCNNAHMRYLYPLFLIKIKPLFLEQDARELEALLHKVYIANSNYKLQGLALWISLASMEFAILDMLGNISNKSVTELIGTRYQDSINVYRANNYRGESAEKSIETIKENVEKSQTKALKVKIGGRMSNNQDYPPDRTVKLIPLVRETFGDDMILYADSNGSYTVDKGIEIGHLLEKYNYSFYEEPCPFDWLEETKMIKDALTIPVSGGEQETSMHRFRWLIANNALDIVQPDLFYFGGMIRCTRVARMAELVGKKCVPHISGSGLGYLYMVHFVSTLKNAGDFHEFKGISENIRFECNTSSLKSENGKVTVPTGPGLGITIDPDFLAKHKPVTLL